jgi:uncharacterized membrane protein
MKRISLYLQSGFYFFAGINHFINPNFYLPLIPDYLPLHELINILSGIVEIILGILLFLPQTRKIASWGIAAMLVLFIPSHVHFIVIGHCVDGGLCVDPWIGWLRLIVIHPLLIFWALYHRS